MPSPCFRGFICPGSWASAACRDVIPPDSRYDDVGFRLVRGPALSGEASDQIPCVEEAS